jgi:O-acetyl-ADP-ribose deacetylase (regulator of RNase III)
MDAGADMLYPAQAVDGVVTLLGGSELRAQLQAVPCNGLKDEAGQPLRCQIGDSVITSGRCGQLPFDLVAHAVPPFWSDGNWERALCSAYASSLEGLVGRSGTAAELWIASPLLGSGARGAPSKQAAEAATSELVAWLVDAEQPPGEVVPTLRFRFVVLPGDGQAALRTVCGAIAAAVEGSLQEDALEVL